MIRAKEVAIPAGVFMCGGLSTNFPCPCMRLALVANVRTDSTYRMVFVALLGVIAVLQMGCNPVVAHDKPATNDTEPPAVPRTTERGSQDGTPDRPQEPRKNYEPFLGFPEDRAKTTADENPVTSTGDRVLMSAVRLVEYETYSEFKESGWIEVEESRGEFVYFAIVQRTLYHVPIAGGRGHGTRIDTTTYRYKARLPMDGKN